MSREARRTSEEAQRNEAHLWRVIQPFVRPGALALELGSGSGEHARAWARRSPATLWQPSDPDPIQRASVDAWCEELANVLPAMDLDAGRPPWPIREPPSLIVLVHVLHVAEAHVGERVLAEATRVLAPGGALVIHGVFLDERGAPPSPRMAEFDRTLSARDPRHGLREPPSGAGLLRVGDTPYEADQRTLVFTRRTG